MLTTHSAYLRTAIGHCKKLQKLAKSNDPVEKDNTFWIASNYYFNGINHACAFKAAIVRTCQSVKTCYKRLANTVCSLGQRMSRECWMEVFDHRKADEIVTALSASQDLAAYVQPPVYSMIAWEWNTVPGARILHLLQAVLLCAGLASNIQHVSILSSSQYVRIGEWKKDPRDGQDESLWSQDLESFSNVVEQSQSVVNKVQFPDTLKWNEALRMGDPYVYTAILSQLHNLQSLRLELLCLEIRDLKSMPSPVNQIDHCLMLSLLTSAVTYNGKDRMLHMANSNPHWCSRLPQPKYRPLS